MSFLPLLMNELSDYCRRPNLRELYGQNFGLGLLDDEIVPSSLLSTGYLRPWRNLSRANSGVSSIQIEKDEFKINLDVQQFKPEELKVKVTDGYIVVEGKHEERSDEHGLVSRQFTRRYKIPNDADVSGLVSNLSSDGVLTLKAPKKQVVEKSKEIPIIQTNVPAVKKETPQEPTQEQTAVKKETHQEPPQEPLQEQILEEKKE